MDLYDLVLSQIKEYNLLEFEFDFMISQLSALNNKPYYEMKNIVQNLIDLNELDINNKTIVKDDVVKVDEFEIDKAYRILNKKDNRAKRNSRRIRGKLDRTKNGYAFLLPFEQGYNDIFVAEKDLRGATNGDVVIVEAYSTGKDHFEGRVVQIIERSNSLIVGKINITKKNASVMPDDVKFGKDIYVPLNKVNGASNGDKVVVKIEKYYNNKKSPDGVVVEVLGAPDKIETEVLSIIRAYNLYEKFSKKAQTDAENMPTKIDKINYPNRLDYSNDICFTIDGEDSRDLDDAISLTVNKNGNRVLGVHIADVGEYVKINSNIDKDAYIRGTSVYFPSLVLPMLPRELSNGICSLNELVDRLAISVFIEYDKDANVIDSKICESIINSKKRFTYTEVQSIFDGNAETIANNTQFVNILTNMKNLSHQLLEKRTLRGGVDFNLPEISIKINSLGGVSGIEQKFANDSNRLIEAFMVAANEVVAKTFFDLKLPFVYRVHEEPDSTKMLSFFNFIKKLGVNVTAHAEKVSAMDLQKILKQVKGKPSEFAVNRIALRSLKKAKYNPICLGHFCLASEFYCHFTSPIRRYPDLTIHRIIKDYLHNNLNEKLLETKRFVLTSSIQSSETEITAEKVERDIDDLYRATFMQDKIGEEFDAVVSSVVAFGVFVLLNNTVEGLIKYEDLPNDNYDYIEEDFTLKGNAHNFYIGKKLRVKLVNVNIKSRQIDFICVE